MARRPAIASPEPSPVQLLDGGFRLVAVLGAVLVVAMAARLALDAGGGAPAPGWTFPPEASGAAGAGPSGSGSASAEPVDLATYIDPAPSPAPPIELSDPNAQPFALSSLRGGPVLVFFGYTHCPDVCPATIGTIGLTMDAFGPGVRAVFVSIDPERDTGEWLREYVRFLPAGFTALTGTAAEIRATADAWGVKYARVETGDPNAYSMSHTATVFLVDADGLIRARFPFGTEWDVMTAVLRNVVASAAPSAMPTPTASSGSPPASTASPASAPASDRPAVPIDVDVVSTSVWAGGGSPVILDLLADGARLDDPELRPSVQLVDGTGRPAGPAVQANPVQPPGLSTVSYVAVLDIPSAGPWQIRVTGTRDGTALAGTAALNVLDPGGTAALGAPAPTIRTPTLADVGGDPRAVTTDPAPDLRLSERSTSDALTAGQPFVLVVDSTKFRVSPACGRAIIMARFLLDRWRDVAFVHLEPYRYSVITDTAVLDGTLDDPKLNDPAEAWGVGAAPWGVRSMPWAFVVDGSGVVRAKYQGVMGSSDVDVILAWLALGGG